MSVPPIRRNEVEMRSSAEIEFFTKPSYYGFILIEGYIPAFLPVL
jgi:hypothetical protein